MNNKAIKLVFAVALCILFFSACNNSTQKKEAIKIGFINPMTGELATYGEAVKRGVDLALEEANSHDLLKGKALEIIMEDSKGESKTALSSLQKMISVDGVKYVIGDISSSVTLAMLPVTERSNVFLFSPGAATPKLTNVGKLFARNWPSNNEEANSAAEYSFNKSGYKSSIIVYVNNDWGLGLMENFEKRFTQLGGTIVAKEIYTYESVDFRTLILKLKSQKADCIYLAGNQKEMGNFMKQLRESKNEIPVISNTSFLEKDCLALAGPAGDGVIVPTPAYNPTDSTNTIKIFYEAIKKKYNVEPTLAEANGYDAVMLIIEAINKEGNDPIKVANYIRNLKNHNGAGGLVNFTNGDISVNNEYKIIVNGIPQVIK